MKPQSGAKSHKFAVGQTVNLNPGPYEKTSSRGHYTIRRLLPIESRDIQYRVQSAADGHERVVLESQIRDTVPEFFKTIPPK